MKEELLKIAKSKVKLRLDEAKKAMNEAQAAANEDTKSSAGDKFETSRAMAQNDRNLYARQWHEAKNDWDILALIDPQKVLVVANKGALVETEVGHFFLATSVGVLEIESKKIMLASLGSPIGLALKGKQKGDTFLFRNKEMKILKVS